MRSSLTLLVLSLACTSALAQAPDSRRRMYSTQDGFLEVDPRSGAITECNEPRTATGASGSLRVTLS